MVSPLPSTFASAAAAAAGPNTHDNNVRRDSERPRRLNGPQTFRRSSVATTPSTHRDAGVTNTASGGSSAINSSASAAPAAHSGSVGGGGAAGSVDGNSGPAPAAGRYTKDQLLSIYKSASQTPGWPASAVADFFLADWNMRVPSAAVLTAVGAAGEGELAGAAADSTGPWGKDGKEKDKDKEGTGLGTDRERGVRSLAQRVGPEICWDHSGACAPLTLKEMEDEEKELFSTSVNSPLKPPPAKNAQTNPDATSTPSRKPSLAPFSSTAGGTGPGSTSRPSTRRRDTGDVGLGGASPVTTPTASSRFFKNFRDRAAGDDEDAPPLATPGSVKKDPLEAAFAGLKRGSASAAAGGAGANAWSGPAGGFGAFGNFSLTPSKDADASKRPSLAASGRGESRFKNLLSRDKEKEKDGEKGDGKEGDKAGKGGQPGKDVAGGDDWTTVTKTRKQRSETNPFGEDDVPPGISALHQHSFGMPSTSAAPASSAALNVDMDMDMPSVQLPSDIQAELSGDHFDIEFGLPAGLRELVTDNKPPGSGRATPSRGEAGQSGAQAHNPHEPNSPTNTNPYDPGEARPDESVRSEAADVQTNPDADATHVSAPSAAPGLTNIAQLREEAMGSHPSSPFAAFRRPDAVDRSQSSSIAPGVAGRPFTGFGGLAGLAGLGGLGGASAAPGGNGSMVSSPVIGSAAPAGMPGSGTATPTRQQAAAQAAAAAGLGPFNDPIFGNMGMKGFGNPMAGFGGGLPGMMGVDMMGGSNAGGMPGMSGMAGLPGMGMGGGAGLGGMGMGMSPGLGMATPGGQQGGPMTSSGRQSKMGALFGNTGDAGGDRGGAGNDAQSQAQSRASPFEGALPGQTRTPGGLLNPLGGLDFGGFAGMLGTQGQAMPHPPPTTAAAPGDGQGQGSATGSISGDNNFQQDGKGNLPASQQRQMVMPDRMRWIYRDPQGNTQGPWSGLEMHDWFKAGFFTAELQVKKLEDEEYEPLAQLVRRIGNSREPFLVPQIGVPHGPEPSQPSQWGAGSASAAQPVPGGAAQPPFAGSFPSFGTTLTADQQNALERRKQEEQFLMARQKEHLAQQQAFMRMQAQAAQVAQVQAQAVQAQAAQAQAQAQAQAMGAGAAGPETPLNAAPGLAGLQHQPSLHSLQNQPSFGSLGPNAPGAPGQLPPLFGMPGLLGTDVAGGLNLDAFGAGAGPDELPGLFDRLNVGAGRGQLPFGSAGAAAGGAPGVGRPQDQQQQQQGQGGPTQAQQDAHMQNVQDILQERANLAKEQEQYDQAVNAGDAEEAKVHEERLKQFQDLREERERAEEAAPQPEQGQAPASQEAKKEETRSDDAQAAATGKGKQQKTKTDQPTLTEQVQKAAAAQQKQQTEAAQNQSVWGKVDTNVAAPFPPPVSQSPLPAPYAQRSRSNVAENLAREQNKTIETGPPVGAPAPPPAAPASKAPWAKAAEEVPKGPSLKEIQEAEAKKAAEQEEQAAAARRAALEQERLSQPPPPAPGLPSTANWASPAAAKEETKPGIPATSVWGKQGGAKAAATPVKKTLAQIQKEEEARKQKLAAQQQAAAVANTAATQAQASTTTTASANTPAGKRYADLVGKMAQPASATTSAPTAAAGGAWTTVGAGGKVKAPPAPAPAARPSPAPAAVKPAPRPSAAAAVAASSPAPAVNNTARALDELTKWAKGALRNGLNANINVDDFVQQLVILPPEGEIISDCVYANSTTLDGRRFGEEFVRRRKLADKGVVESAGQFADQTEGWNEVAKKGPARGVAAQEESVAEFKVVSKKKGKR